MVSAENSLVNHFILNISFGNSFVVVLLFIALILSRAFAELLLQMSYDRKIFFHLLLAASKTLARELVQPVVASVNYEFKSNRGS